MVYIILLFLILGGTAYFTFVYRNFLDQQNIKLNFIIEKMRVIFDNTLKVTYYGAQKNDSLLYIIEKRDKEQKSLHIHIEYELDIIEFYTIDLDHLYSNNNINRYDGELLIRIDINDLRMRFNNKFISRVRNFAPDLSMRFNSARNKKILFDDLYSSLVDMRRISNGSANTVKISDAKYIQNIFE